MFLSGFVILNNCKLLQLIAVHVTHMSSIKICCCARNSQEEFDEVEENFLRKKLEKLAKNIYVQATMAKR